jgi:MFS family permease
VCFLQLGGSIVAQDKSLKPDNSKPQFYYGYFVVLSAFCILGLMYGTRYSFGVFFKPMINEFNWTRALISGSFSMSTIVQGVLSIIMGGLNDRFGPRAVLTFCGFMVGMGYLLMSQISSAWQLYLFYTLIIGVGMSGGFVPILSTVARWFTKRRSVMTGISMAGIGVGNFIFPPIVNWLIAKYSWQTTFIFMGCIVLVAIIVAAQFLRRQPSQFRTGPDSVMSGENQKLNVAALGLSLREAIRTRQLWMGMAIFFCLGFAVMTITVHIVPYATDIGISSASAAGILAVLGVAGLTGGILIGGLADKITNRRTWIICFIIMLVSFVFTIRTPSLLALYLFVVLFNFGAGGGGTLESPLAAELFGVKSHGAIFGVMGLGFCLGSAAGPFMAGYIFDASGSYRLAFTACVIVLTIGLILALGVRPVDMNRTLADP